MGTVEEVVTQDCAKGLAPASQVEATVLGDCAKGLSPVGAIETQTVFQAPAMEARVLNPTVSARADLVVGR